MFGEFDTVDRDVAIGYVQSGSRLDRPIQRICVGSVVASQMSRSLVLIV